MYFTISADKVKGGTVYVRQKRLLLRSGKPLLYIRPQRLLRLQRGKQRRLPERFSKQLQSGAPESGKEIEKAEKYVKELNMKMSKDAFKHEIIEILNTLTVDNYKNILNALFLLIFLEENDKEKNDINNNNMNISLKNYILNKPEYLLHNQN